MNARPSHPGCVRRLHRAAFLGAVWGTMSACVTAVAQTAPAAIAPAVDALPAPQRLQAGGHITGRVSRGEPLAYRVEAPPGHVVQGTFDGQGAVLDLQDAQGRHVRRLGQTDATPQGFMWVARDAQNRLVVRTARDGGGAHPGRFTLEITRTLAPAADAPAAPAAHGAPGPSSTVPTSPRLIALQQALAGGGDTRAALDAFWQARAREGTPMVEPLSATEFLVTFLWRGAHDNVRLFGSPSGNHDPLTKLAGSDVWWASFKMPNTARLSYRLAPDVPRVQGSPQDQRRVILATAQRDPLNPRAYPSRPGQSAIDAFQDHSFLALPQAPAQPWIQRREGVAPGTLTHHRLSSQVLRNDRDVWIYRPHGAAPRALLVLFDAHAYIEQVPTPTIVDNLLADGLIPPTAVVLIGNPSPQARSTELPPNPTFAAFLDQELMPWVRTLGLAQPPARTVIAGSSYGGLTSAYAGLTHPQWFGNVLSLSGSFWWSPQGSMPNWVARQVVAAPRRDVRFYLDAGRYESARGGQDGILETNRHLGHVLRAKGYTVTQVEHDTGHDYLHWQGSLGCGLVALLSPVRFDGLAACRGQAPASGDLSATPRAQRSPPRPLKP